MVEGACKPDAFPTVGLAKVGAWTVVGACKSDAFPTVGLAEDGAAEDGAWTVVGACKSDAFHTVGLVTIFAGASVGAFTTVAVSGVGAFTTVASAGVGAGAIVVGALRSVLSFDVGLAKTGLVALGAWAVAAGVLETVLCPEVGQAPTRGSLNEASLCDSHSAHLLHGIKLHLTSNAPVCSAHHELHPSFDSPDVGLVELRLELGAGADTPHDTGQFECM